MYFSFGSERRYKLRHDWRCDSGARTHMSNFGDAEDQALVQLAVRLCNEKGEIDWNGVVKQFPWQGKTRLALRQRLKTLKYTYGKNLRQFPSRFFRALGRSHGAVMATTSPAARLVFPQKYSSIVHVPTASSQQRAPTIDSTPSTPTIPCRPQPANSATTVQTYPSPIEARSKTIAPAPIQPYVSTLESFCQLLDYPDGDLSDDDRSSFLSSSVSFTKLIRRPKPAPQAHPVMGNHAVYDAIDRIFVSFTRADVCQPSGRRDLNSGEIAPIGVTTLLEFLQLTNDDVFGDIGSGTGSVLAQAAMQTSVHKCVGLETRRALADKSRSVIQEWSTSFPSLSRVIVLTGDIRDHIPSTSKLVECTVILSNNMLFEHTSNTSLQAFICSSSTIHTVLLTERVCYRCNSRCLNEFCKLWVLSKTLSIVSCWSPKVDVFVYHKKAR